MTGPEITAALSLVVVIAMLALVVFQPSRIWRDSAEHSKPFWLLWALGSVVIGAIPIAIGGFGWGEAVWLALWCACAALQPAMIVDLLDVRRQVRRRRRATLELRAQRAAGPRPISWRVEP